MVNLTRASRELFSRTPDERFDSFDALLAHCQERKFQAIEHWQPSQTIRIEQDAGQLLMRLEQAEDVTLSLSDWSFSQLCDCAKFTRRQSTSLRPRRRRSSFATRCLTPVSRCRCTLPVTPLLRCIARRTPVSLTPKCSKRSAKPPPISRRRPGHWRCNRALCR